MANPLSRRTFLLGASALLLPDYRGPERMLTPTKGGLEKLASPNYSNLKYSDFKWEELQKGLYFARTDITRGAELVDRIAIVKIAPQDNILRVFTNFEARNPGEYNTVEQWQKETGASVVFNSAQYQGNPNYGAPVALVLADGKPKGPINNRYTRGMLVAEPKLNGMPLIDLLDFEFDKFDHKTTPYTQGVQHWPILLDRRGKIRVKSTDWQANRTVVAKAKDGNILVFVTEGGFFTLYNFGKFLRESSFNVHTAMNMDGGYEASMCIRSPKLGYTTYGQFETYGPGRDVSVPGARIGIPTAIGIFPRG